jgi:hypothetical protein
LKPLGLATRIDVLNTDASDLGGYFGSLRQALWILAPGREFLGTAARASHRDGSFIRIKRILLITLIVRNGVYSSARQAVIFFVLFVSA